MIRIFFCLELRFQRRGSSAHFSSCFLVSFRWNFEVMNTVIEALQGEQAVIFGSYLKKYRRINGDKWVQQNFLLGNIFLDLSYQTLRVCQGLTALPSDVCSCIWPWHRQKWALYNKNRIFRRKHTLDARAGHRVSSIDWNRD